MKHLLTALIVLKILGYWNYSWWWITAPASFFIVLSFFGRKCPVCQEEIKMKATKCKHCHSILTTKKEGR